MIELRKEAASVSSLSFREYHCVGGPKGTEKEKKNLTLQGGMTPSSA
jgi:hypothetical protein